MDDLTAFVTARLDEDEAAVKRYGLGERSQRSIGAKRAILAEHGADLPLDYACLSCQRDEAWPCRTLRLLAAVWSDHPDYKQEWSTDGT